MSGIKLQSEYDDLDKYDDGAGNIYYRKKDTNIRHNPYSAAIIYKDGTKVYYINNKLHRLDGPAVIYDNNEDQYWINNEYLSKEEFELHPERLKFIGKGYLTCLT